MEGRDTEITCTIDRFGKLKSGSKYAMGTFRDFFLRLLFFDISLDNVSQFRILIRVVWVTVVIGISFFDGRYLIWLLRKKSREGRKTKKKCTERRRHVRTRIRGKERSSEKQMTSFGIWLDAMSLSHRQRI